MERIEAGDSRQFTVTMSVPPDENPWLAVYDSTSGDTLIGSYTSQRSGTAWGYYHIYTVPNSRGFYYYEWNFEVSAISYKKRGVFEVVKTDADWSGLYCVPNDIRDLYPKIDTINGLTNKKINTRIQDMDGIINLRLSTRYTVPFPVNTSSFPPIIKFLSKHMTLIDILKNQSVKRAGDIPEWIESREKQLEKILTGLETGSYTLVDSAGNAYTSVSDGKIWGSKTSFHPVFSMLDYEEQQVDTDYLDELADEIESDL